MLVNGNTAECGI